MKTIGMIAGNGKFPFLVLKEARAQGYRVVICGIKEETHPDLEKAADAFQWVKLGELKKLSDFFHRECVHEAIMAGKVEKVKIFQGNVKPDFEMVKILMKLKNFKDDTLLGAVADYLHSKGIDLLDSTVFLKYALPGVGLLGKRRPTEDCLNDMRFGFDLAKSIAGLDVGQTVVVKKKAVLSVEAVEGTDRAIRRGGELGKGKVTVVKVAKPNQDMRFDVPVVGMKTLDSLIAAEAQGFAFEAGKTLFIEQEEFIKEANKKGIALMGFQS